MKYYVTYCAMDQRLANPLWHTCLILSKHPAKDSKIQVKHVWGFYPVGISDPDTLFSKFKKALGFYFDLQGNFGVLKIEEMRYLDLGYGLRGVTFEINETQYDHLTELCKQKINEQENAIEEAKARIGKSASTMKIFEEEKKCALAENRKSRLDRFDFCVSVTESGLSCNDSYTCKTVALELLGNIGIQKKYLDELTLQNTSLAFPKYSGELEEIFLHSTGPRHEYQSERTGAITFFRQWSDKQDKLYWSFPPQLVRLAAPSNPDNEHHDYSLPIEWVKDAKKTLSQLQQIEHVVVNAEMSYQYNSYRQPLLNHIINLYDKFSVLHHKSDEVLFLEHLFNANDFVNRLYNAITERRMLEDNIASYAILLDAPSQTTICKILGRPAIVPEDANEDDLTNSWNPIVSLTRF